MLNGYILQRVHLPTRPRLRASQTSSFLLSSVPRSPVSADSQGLRQTQAAPAKCRTPPFCVLHARVGLRLPTTALGSFLQAWLFRRTLHHLREEHPPGLAASVGSAGDTLFTATFESTRARHAFPAGMSAERRPPRWRSPPTAPRAAASAVGLTAVFRGAAPPSPSQLVKHPTRLSSRSALG